MIEQEFYALSEKILTKISDDVEAMDSDAALDVEYSDGILNITIEATGQIYVINRHSASQKIWYSSPISGADYFVLDLKVEKWLDADNIELAEKLFAELSQFIQIK